MINLSERMRSPDAGYIEDYADEVAQLEAELAEYKDGLEVVRKWKDEAYTRNRKLKAELKATYELLDVYEKENQRLRELLDNSRKCIRSVEDKSIFGIGESDGMSRWYLADELLSYIDDALKEGE